jgi:predicted O-methyltransferase YrrM
MTKSASVQPESAPRRSAVCDVLERLHVEGTVAAPDGSTHELFPVAIPAAEGEALREQVIRENASMTLEVGLGYAVSALYACDGLIENGDASAMHVAVDPFQRSRFANCGLQLLAEAGVAQLVEHHPKPSQLVLPRFLLEGRSFDLAFIDGDHRFDRVFVDLYYAARLVRPGGVVILDDYQLPAIERAASFFTNNVRWTLEELSPPDPHHQWVVLRTSELPDRRPFDFFVDFEAEEISKCLRKDPGRASRT